jgi:hypothetical protein
MKVANMLLPPYLVLSCTSPHFTVTSQLWRELWPQFVKGQVLFPKTMADKGDPALESSMSNSKVTFPGLQFLDIPVFKGLKAVAATEMEEGVTYSISLYPGQTPPAETVFSSMLCGAQPGCTVPFFLLCLLQLWGAPGSCAFL